MAVRGRFEIISKFLLIVVKASTAMGGSVGPGLDIVKYGIACEISLMQTGYLYPCFNCG